MVHAGTGKGDIDLPVLLMQLVSSCFSLSLSHTHTHTYTPHTCAHQHRGVLAEQFSKMLYDPMPVIWFKPGL